MAQAPAPIERTVWFYRIFVRQDGDAIAPLNTVALCEAINGLRFPYMATKNGEGVICVGTPQLHDRFRMLRVRWSDHPSTWTRRGLHGELNLPADVALTEPTHCRFFGNNIVAIDVNRSGPWPTTLRDYVRHHLEGYRTFEMIQIPDKTALQRLKRIHHITSMSLRVTRPTLAKIPERGNPWVTDFNAMVKFAAADKIEVAWQRWHRQTVLDTGALKSVIQYFIEHGNEDVDTDRSQITLKGTDRHGELATFNLTRDYVVEKVKIRRSAQRTIDSADAFSKLGIAFNSVMDRFPPQDFLIE